MLIQVTRKDIDCGIEGDAISCPVARAIEREIGTDVSFRVDAEATWIRGIPFWHPPKIARWICRFDAGHPVKPMGFEFSNNWRSLAE